MVTTLEEGIINNLVSLKRKRDNKKEQDNLRKKYKHVDNKPLNFKQIAQCIKQSQTDNNDTAVFFPLSNAVRENEPCGLLFSLGNTANNIKNLFKTVAIKKIISNENYYYLLFSAQQKCLLIPEGLFKAIEKKHQDYNFNLVTISIPIKFSDLMEGLKLEIPWLLTKASPHLYTKLLKAKESQSVRELFNLYKKTVTEVRPTEETKKLNTRQLCKLLYPPEKLIALSQSKQTIYFSKTSSADQPPGEDNNTLAPIIDPNL